MNSFQKSQAQKILSMYNNSEENIEKGRKEAPLGSHSKDGTKIKTAQGWKSSSGIEKENKESNLSKLKDEEGTLYTNEGEKLNYRIYKDGGVKIEGSNIRKDFASKQEAEDFIKEQRIK